MEFQEGRISQNGAIKKISIIVPAHNEFDNIAELYSRLNNVLCNLEKYNYEIIIVDDGSTDDTWSSIIELNKKDQNTMGIRLSRSFGHQYALFAGLNYATGDAVVSMDADLQHPPEIIPKLIEKWRKGNQIVHTIREDPPDFSLSKKIFAKYFYKLFGFLSGVEVKPGMADFRLLDRQVINDILKFREEGLFLRGIVQWVGYPNTSIKYLAEERYSGESKYTFKKMLRFAWHGVSSFSVLPLRIGIIIGLLTSMLSFYLVLDALHAKFILKTTVPGWTSMFGVMTLLFGILFIFLSLLGEYIGRILVQVRHRPLFIVSDSIGLNKSIQHTHNFLPQESFDAGN